MGVKLEIIFKKNYQRCNELTSYFRHFRESGNPASKISFYLYFMDTRLHGYDGANTLFMYSQQ